MIGCVEIAGEAMLLHVFEKRQGEHSYVDTVRLERPGADQVPRDLQSVVLSLPPDSLHFRILSFPFAEREKIEEVLPLQLGGMISHGIDSIVSDFHVIERSDQGFRVIIVFAMKDMLRKVLSSLERFGIKPEVITSLVLFDALSRGSLDSLLGPEIETTRGVERLKEMARMLSSTTVNLAKGEFFFRKELQVARRYMRITGILATVVALLLVTHFSLSIRNTVAMEKALRQHMTKLYTQLVPEDRKVVDPIYQLKAQMKQMTWKREEINDARPLDVLSGIARVWNKGWALESVAVSRDLVTVTGEAANAQEAQAVAAALHEEIGAEPVVETKQTSEGKTGYSLQLKRGGEQ